MISFTTQNRQRGNAVRAVYVVAPGGARAPGGMGRMVDYFTRSWPQGDLPLRIIDTYGAKEIKALMPLYFAGALLRIGIAGVRGEIAVLDVHMSEKLSVFRKGVVVYLGKALGVPVLLHLHAGNFADHCRALPAPARRWVAHLLAQADAVVVLGQFWRNFVRDELGLADKRIVVMHNAVPGPAALPTRDVRGPCRLLFLGRMGAHKGVPVLLSALARLQLDERLAWQATLVGDGEVEATRAECQRLALVDRVQVLGWTDEAAVRTLLAASEVLVLPSRNEGLPMAILEAMAHGLAIVATPVGSITDAVRDGETGLLVPVDDPDALANALARLIGDPGLRRQLGHAGRNLYLECFEQSAFNRRLSGLFHAVIEKAGIGRHAG
jgi:glycosyltransferase involved in cell wall biosynthesis